MKSPRNQLPPEDRCFIGVPLPDSAKAAVGSLVRRLEATNTGVFRAVEQNDLHLTLYFLGSVPTEQATSVIERCENIEWAAFKLKAGGVVSLPESTVPKVLALAIQSENRELGKLQSRVHDAVFSLDVFKETRPFTPHVTFARLKRGVPSSAKAVKRSVAAIQSVPEIEWTVDAFNLYRRHETDGGTSYEVLRSFPAR